MDEDRDLGEIEELSQKLEALYKDMEQIRRENLLFESYLLRHSKDKDTREEEYDQGRKKKKDKQLEKRLLTNEEKYEIANFESEALKKNIDEGRIRSDSILETLRAILEETDMAITEIRKDAFDFQREILIGGENSRTRKIEAEKIVKYREEKLRQKDAMIEKYKAKKATLESQIIKAENAIKKKEEMGDDLKFIDFHQLQIENKKYVKEIEEKNTKLLNLKTSTGQIVTKLTNERKRLNREIDLGDQYRNEIKEKIENIEKLKKEIEKVEKEKKTEYETNKRLEAQKEQMKDIPQIMGYVQQKLEHQNVSYQVKNLERKIEIAELAFIKAQKVIKVADYPSYEMEKGKQSSNTIPDISQNS